MRSVELFAGVGGLALGAAKAGFRHEAVVEWDQDACETIRANQERKIKPVKDWPLTQADVRKFDYSGVRGDIDLLAGGPPCQPFSLGGKHRGFDDERDMFPEMVRAVRELKPRAILVENVKGLRRPSFAKYFEYILLQITYPEIVRRASEDWAEHLTRLERYHTKGSHDGLFYRVVFRTLNAADYGVPQRRERVVMVGFRCDFGREWSFPEPTHYQDVLLWDQWVSGEYWERHEVSKKNRPEVPERLRIKVGESRDSMFKPIGQPWRTTRDAIADLPDPEKNGDSVRIANHRFMPGAKSYPGHTGSPLDEPAKTLKAGDHGVPGGENTVLFPDGRFRYFTVRESARIQTFPDDYIFAGSWTESMRQLGNAVPVHLGQVIAKAVRKHLERVQS